MSKVRFEEGDLEGGKYLDVGTHDCVISSIEHKLAKSSGLPQAEITFTSQSGKSCRDWFMLEGGGKFKLAQLALAAGIKKEVLLSGNFDTVALGGKVVKVIRRVTGQKEVNGTMRDQYENDYLPAPEAQALASNAGAPSDDTIPF